MHNGVPEDVNRQRITAAYRLHISGYPVGAPLCIHTPPPIRGGCAEWVDSLRGKLRVTRQLVFLAVRIALRVVAVQELWNAIPAPIRCVLVEGVENPIVATLRARDVRRHVVVLGHVLIIPRSPVQPPRRRILQVCTTTPVLSVRAGRTRPRPAPVLCEQRAESVSICDTMTYMMDPRAGAGQGAGLGVREGTLAAPSAPISPLQISCHGAVSGVL